MCFAVQARKKEGEVAEVVNAPTRTKREEGTLYNYKGKHGVSKVGVWSGKGWHCEHGRSTGCFEKYIYTFFNTASRSSRRVISILQSDLTY